MSEPLPPDPGRLVEVRPVDDQALRIARAAEEAARNGYFGAEAGSWEQRQADVKWYSARNSAEGAYFEFARAADDVASAKSRNERLMAVDTNRNGQSDYTENRQAEEKRLLSAGVGLAGAVAGVSLASQTLDAAAAGPAAPSAAAPSLLNRFADVITPRGEMKSFEPTATATFNARAIAPDQLGFGSAMTYTQSLLPAPGYTAVPEILPATTSPITPAAEPPTAAPALARLRNQAMVLENSLASGPKPPTWVTQTSKSANSSAE